MTEATTLQQHWRNALAERREASFCLRLVDRHWLKVSQAWRESAAARAIVLTVEPSIGRIDWQVADQDAVLESCRSAHVAEWELFKPESQPFEEGG